MHPIAIYLSLLFAVTVRQKQSLWFFFYLSTLTAFHGRYSQQFWSGNLDIQRLKTMTNINRHWNKIMLNERNTNCCIFYHKISLKAYFKTIITWFQAQAEQVNKKPYHKVTVTQKLHTSKYTQMIVRRREKEVFHWQAAILSLLLNLLVSILTKKNRMHLTQGGKEWSFQMSVLPWTVLVYSTADCSWNFAKNKQKNKNLRYIHLTLIASEITSKQCSLSFYFIFFFFANPKENSCNLWNGMNSEQSTRARIDE